MNKTISAANAPAAVGPYCHAKLAGNTLYTSGQLGLVPATGALPEGVEAQARQALDNLGAVLQAAGMDFADVTKTTVFLTDINDFAAVNSIYAEYFTGQAPARSCVRSPRCPRARSLRSRRSPSSDLPPCRSILPHVLCTPCRGIPPHGVHFRFSTNSTRRFSQILLSIFSLPAASSTCSRVENEV